MTHALGPDTVTSSGHQNLADVFRGNDVTSDIGITGKVLKSGQPFGAKLGNKTNWNKLKFTKHKKLKITEQYEMR